MVKPTTLVIIPTYNEAENIGRLLLHIRSLSLPLAVLVVDDSSPDGTAHIIRRFQPTEPWVHLLEQPLKQGLSAAYIAGFRWGLSSQHFQNFIEMDADFSHDPDDLPRFLNELKTTDAVVGCRYMEGGETKGWSWLRKVVSKGGNLYAKKMLSLPYSDLTGGFNGWTRQTLEEIDIGSIRSRGYAFQVELKWRAHKMGRTLKEIPILFRDRTRGRSKMSTRIFGEAALRVLEMRRIE